MKKFLSFLSILFLFSTVLFSQELSTASKKDLEQVALNWLAIINSALFDTGVYEYQIAYEEAINAGEDIVAYIYHLSPVGHIVISPYSELYPVKSLSLTSNFDKESDGYERAVIFELESILGFTTSTAPARTGESQ